jgi:signal-transduction protein with cAMP-binding, CBS, and nucleotidyltransferase domain
MTVHLKSVDIFSNLNDHQLLDIADTCTLKVFHRGDRIVEAGKPVNYVFILLNGKTNHTFSL